MPAKAKPQKTDQLQETFDSLKKIYKPFASRLKVAVDTDSYYYLESKTPMFRGKPMCFGMVKMGKGRVAFHMMALYCFPEMKKGISPELKRRMQGKQCFNFARPDETLFAELATLAEQGAKRFSTIKDFEVHMRSQSCD